VAGAPSGLFDRRLSQTASLYRTGLDLGLLRRCHCLPCRALTRSRFFQQAPIRPHGRRPAPPNSTCHTDTPRRRFVVRAAAAWPPRPLAARSRAPPIPTLKYGEARTAAMDTAFGSQVGRRPLLAFRFGCGGAASILSGRPPAAIRAGDSILSPLLINIYIYIAASRVIYTSVKIYWELSKRNRFRV